MSNDDICGEQTAAGTKCTRDAGWGTDRDHGPCTAHEETYHNPSKLDEETKGQILGAAETGAFKDHCAQAAGITEQTLRNWLNWGEADAEDDLDSPCAEFFLEWQRARGRGAVERLGEVDAEFVLERSYGYTKKETREITGEGGGPVDISINETVVSTPHSDRGGEDDEEDE